MDPTALAPLTETAWLWVAGPLLLVAALVVGVRLRAPQLLRLPAGFRALRGHDPEAAGELTPASATWLATAAAWGGAAAVGAATAVSLGGAGALAWVWLFCFLLAGLHFAETLLARTDAPGRGHPERSGSLSARLARGSGAVRALGITLAVVACVTAVAFVGGVHGAAVLDATAGLLPDAVAPVSWGVAGAAAVLGLVGLRRGGAIAGWVALAGLAVLFGVAVWTAASDPSRAFGALGRALGDAFGGAPPATPFVGAAVGEVAMAAMVHLLPPIAATGTVAGGLHSAARARSSRGQAAAALVGPLLYALVTTALFMAFVATGAYYHRIEDRRPLADLRMYATTFETASQRVEPERLHNGYMRIIDGEARDLSVRVATDRAIVRTPSYLYRGQPADLALYFEDGAPARLLVSRDGALSEIDKSEIGEVAVEGQMLPRGGALLSAAAERGAGSLAARMALAALLLLALVGAAAFGFGVRRALPATWPVWAGVGAVLLPAVGLGLAAAGFGEWLGPLGSLSAAALAALTAVGLIALARQAAGLAR